MEKIENFNRLLHIYELYGNCPETGYLKEAKERCMNTSSEQTGLINDIDKFYANLETNCVPVETIEMDFNSYEDFLDKRRKMMAAKIKKYYYSL